MLFHILGVSIEDGLQDVGDELLHLLGCTAHKVLRHQPCHDLLAGQAKGYMMDVENRRLKEELSTAKKEAVRWSNKYHDLWYDVKPYLDALHRAPELVRGFLEKILAPKQELTMNVQQRNRRRGQDMEL